MINLKERLCVLAENLNDVETRYGYVEEVSDTSLLKDGNFSHKLLSTSEDNKTLR